MAVADTAASLQQQYDQAVHEHGAQSPQALEAEREAQQFFKGTPAPEKAGIQLLKESIA